MPMTLEAISWTWFGFVTFVTISRFISRTLHMGSIKALQADDWIMLLAYAAYTVDISILNIVAVTPTNLFPPGTNVSTFTAEDYSVRIFGSKMTTLVEQMQCTCIWSVKAALLIMYLRITQGRKERFWLQLLAGYVAGNFIIMEILYLGVWCRPFSNYWAVPTPNIQCSAATNHLITNAVFNLSSDILLLCIALPIFMKTRMETRKKVAVCGVFGLGIFSIIAAILNKYYSFTNPFGSEWVNWYCHESSTNMMVANLPFVYTLIRRIFKLQAWDSKYYDTGSKPPGKSMTGKIATLLSRKGDASVLDRKDGDFGDFTVTVVKDIAIEEEDRQRDTKELDTEFFGIHMANPKNTAVITGNKANVV